MFARNIFMALAAVVLGIGGLVGGAQAADVPAGPYRKACFDMAVKGTTLEGKCFSSGGQRQVQLSDFEECTPNSITYDPASGVFACRFPFAVPAGPYANSCKKTEVVPSVLTAECPNARGEAKFARLENWRDCEANSIQNSDGVLACTRKFRAPDGSYKQSCETIARESAIVMSASCSNAAGVKGKTSLRFFDACKPNSIRNAAGKLVCDYEGLPVGAYMASCDRLSAVTDEGVPSLKASCRAPGANALTDSTLYNITDCVADSIAVGKDGRLTCTSQEVKKPVPPPGPYLADCRKTWWQADRMLRIGCPKSDGGIKIHVFNALACQDNTIEVDHGTALCTLTSGGKSVLDGSYKQSCGDRWMEGNKLVAKCGYDSVFLPNATNCKAGTVSLMSGRLVCTLANGKSTDVEGPYKKSCATAALRPDNSLIAFCGKVETILAGTDTCEPNTIAFLNGALICRTKTQAPGIPTGKYTDLCYAPKAANGTLAALCPADDGTYREIILQAMGSCEANSVEYKNGSLVCRYSGGRRGIPDGPYQDLCSNASIRTDGILTATCNTGRSASMKKGMPTATLAKWEDCKPGTIDVDHGNLFCTLKTGELTIPAGAYRQRCLDLRIENGDLRGTCETGAHDGFGVMWTKDTTLRQVANCGVGTVRVAEGFLGCTYVKGWAETVPAGEFRQSCRNLTVDAAGSLSGNCYDTTGGGGGLAALPQVALCDPGTIRLTDLAFSCIYKAGAVVPEQLQGPFLDSCKDVKVDAGGQLTAKCTGESGASQKLHFADVRFCVPKTLQVRDDRLWCRSPSALGSFVDTCKVEISDDAALQGKCWHANRWWRDTKLEQFAECERGSIATQDAVLVCTRIPPAKPDAVLPGQKRGAFLKACTDVTVAEDGRLNARCDSGQGTLAAITFPDVRQCRPDSMVNEDGGLWCRPMGLAGSFEGTCSVRLSNAGALKGTCRNDQRDDVQTTLELIERCVRGSIGNANGRLVCERDWAGKLGSVLPEHKAGPFTRTCADIAISDDGRLTAQCANAEGTRTALAFQDVRSCEPNSMANEDGRLWCTPFASLGSFGSSCSVRLNDADALEGTCSGAYRQDIKTKLEQIGTCQPGSVGNTNGTLTCTRVKN